MTLPGFSTTQLKIESINIINGNIHHLLADHDNNLWIGTYPYDSQKGSGLIRFNIDSGDIKQFLHEPTNSNSLLDNRISVLFEDQQGQVLIGTYKSGFHIYDPKNESLNRIGFDANHPNQLHAPYTDDKVFGPMFREYIKIKMETIGLGLQIRGLIISIPELRFL